MRADMRLFLLGFIFVGALVAESIWPLRRATQPKAIRVVRNLGLATVSLLFVRFAFLPFEIWAAKFVTQENLGILNQVSLSSFAKTAISLVLLDYTLYIWHFLNHRISFFWRFHNVHHIDLDLDVSTASRFHFGELAWSSLFRVGQIFLFGVDVPTLILFETCITVFAQFHHANLRLPKWLDSQLAQILITPRLHGVHHSIVRDETDSNFGIVFSCWDRLHRTFKSLDSQSEIIIGVPSYRSLTEQSFANIVAIPFQEQRAWKLPGGEVPARIASAGSIGK